MKKTAIVFIIVALFVITGNANAQITLDEASQKQMVMTNMTSMPLTFTENRGQWNEKALFKADAGGATFWFCGDEIAYVFTRDTDELIDDSRSGSDQREKPDMPDQFDHPRYKKESLVIRAQLIGANPNAEIIGENRLSHNCNYFYGNDPTKWSTDVPNYSSITYKDIYPGIDLKYHGNGQRMKYDFIVNPGADVSQIQIRYEGADNLAITPNGDLEASTLFGSIHENIPSVYQEIGNSKREVTGRYVIRKPGVFGFEVDDYNPSLTLVIDPELVYSTYLGGNNWDGGYGIAVDGNGCAYVTGWTYSSDFPTENPYQTDQGDIDAFVAKLSAFGDSLVYSTYLGGNDYDYPRGIAVDGSGCAYVTGWTYSTDFPTENPYQTDQGDIDTFVAKLSASGNSLVYSTYLGGNDFDYVRGIAVDGSGCAYVTGWTSSTNFPTENPYQMDQGDDDAFVTKLSTSGSSLVYSTYLGGNDDDYGQGIAVDGSGCAYVTGETYSTDFPTENPYQTDQGTNDAFVAKLSAFGDSLVYSTYLGGSSSDEGLSIAVDDNGCAYVTGKTKLNDFPTVNPYDGSFNGGNSDVFVTRFSASGNSLVYSTYLGGSSSDEGWSIAVDDNGCAYVTGWTYSSDFPTVNPYQTYQGWYDGFVTRFSASGDSLVYSTYLAGNSDDYSWGIALDSSGCAYVTGRTSSSDFPTVNPYQTDPDITPDAFVAKFEEGGEPETGTIAGTVTKTDGTSPIEDVLVRALQGVNQAGSDSTDSNGDYSILNLPVGTYDVEALKMGYSIEIVEDVEVIADQTTIVNFELDKCYYYLPGDVSMYNGVWPPRVLGGDVTYLWLYFHLDPDIFPCYMYNPDTPNPSDTLFYASADANGDCKITLSDVVYMTAYFGGIHPSLQYCPYYPPAWYSTAEAEADGEPVGWPYCYEPPSVQYVDSFVSSPDPRVVFWFGHPDSSSISAAIGDTLTVDIYIQTDDSTYGGDIHIPLGINSIYFPNFLDTGEVYFPLDELEPCSFLSPQGSPPNQPGWLSKSLIGLGESGEYSQIHLTTPTKIITFYAQVSGDTNLIDSTINCLDVGGHPALWTLDIGDTIGLGSLPAAVNILPVKFKRKNYQYLPGDVNMANGIWPPMVIGGDVTYLVNYFKGSGDACLLYGFWASADANGDCIVMGSDVIRMVAYFRGAGDIEYCADYPPAWPTTGDLPTSAPDGWPNCETPTVTEKVLPSGSDK